MVIIGPSLAWSEFRMEWILEGEMRRSHRRLLITGMDLGLGGSL